MLPGQRPLTLLVCALVTLVTLATLVACKRPTAAEGGRQLFASSCARCHGSGGAGGVAVAGVPTPRNFRDHAFQTERTDEQLKQVIANGKGTAMPPFGAMFTDAQLAELVGHVRSLDPVK